MKRPMLRTYVLLAWTIALLGSLAAAAEPDLKAIRLHVAPEPDPALRYVFWPAPENRIQGNASTFVTRAIILRLQSYSDPSTTKPVDDKFTKWIDTPLDKLPLDEVKEYLATSAAPALKDLDRAENLMRIDYDLRLAELSMHEMVSTLLPEMQEYRSLARLLQLRARVAIVEERWDDFAHDVRVGFRLGELTSEGNDLLISRLVGLAINFVFLSCVEEAIQRPGCPNFYWALASIPDQSFEMREAIEYESILLAKLTTSVGPLPDSSLGAVRSRELLRRFADEASSLFETAGLAPVDDAARDLMVGTAVVSLTDVSREFLEQDSKWAGRTHELSSSEAVLRATVLQLQRSRHNWLKWAMLPRYLSGKYLERAQDEMAGDTSDSNLFVLLAKQLVPGVNNAENAGRRGEQRRNLLITLEALRMHAKQTGQLPETLVALEPVPAWHDSFSNELFTYQRNTATQAILRHVPRTAGDEQAGYEITIVQPTDAGKLENSQ